MKKSILVLGCLVLATLVPMMTCPVQAWMASVKWINPVYRGTDNFLGATVVAYEEGTTATLAVNVRNHYTEDANVTVTVQMDWETRNWTSKTEVPKGLSHVFKVNIPIPSTTKASNLATHSYTITIEYNRTGTVTSESHSYSDLAVYSSDQADAQELAQKLDDYDYPVPAPGVINYYRFDCFEARVLWEEGDNENALGDDSYNSGNFTGAKTHYENAQTKYNEALSILTSRGKELENADITSANAAMYEALAWVIFGIGIVFVGIGVIIYAAKKPKAVEAV